MPDDVSDPDQLDEVIQMVNDLGLQVLENAPEDGSDFLANAAQNAQPAITENEMGTIESEVGRTTDPVRLYMREMGSVELLSSEGEIAIAKRIEAGKDVMLIALSQSPITAQQFFEWNEKLQKDEILVREIIDIDTNYMEDGTSTTDSKKDIIDDDKEKDNKSNQTDDDEFNPTLAAMEMEIKPKVLKTISNLCKDYLKLIKYQKEKLECVLNNSDFTNSKEKSYQKIVAEILENIKSLLYKNRIEKILLVDESFGLKGLITLKDINKSKDYPSATKDSEGRLLVAAAIGNGTDTEERTEKLVQAGVDVLVVDSAHGHSQGILERVEKIKKDYPNIDVIGGNLSLIHI
mgnify:CR=1 FL=1